MKQEILEVLSLERRLDFRSKLGNKVETQRVKGDRFTKAEVIEPLKRLNPSLLPTKHHYKSVNAIYVKAKGTAPPLARLQC